MASAGADKIGEDAQVNPEPIVKAELTDRSNLPEGAGASGELSKNAAKKAAKREKQAADKGSKAKDKPIGVAEARKPSSKPVKKKIEGAALIGIDVAKEEDFSGWYQQVLTKGDMLDYYDVSGCYILKVSPTICYPYYFYPNFSQPASYFIWEQVQTWFNSRIKKMGVKNCSFPLFVTEEVLNREKAHVEGFAAEVAWVTHA